MIAPLLAVTLLATIQDPCAVVEPLAESDPVVAAAYLAVGDAERDAGAHETAVAAYRAALARDPASAARQELRALCAEGPSPGELFRRAVRLAEEGDLRGAAATFQQVRRASPDPSAALLEGICRYELGEDAAARQALRAAEAAPDHRDHARFYLGLVSLRSGSPAEAASLFDSVAGHPALARAASDLARAARSESRLVVSLLAQSGWDSNVNLAPSGLPGFVPSSDFTYALAGSALYRPLGPSGPYARLGGQIQEQLELGAYDGGALDAAAGWQLGRDERGLQAEYGFSYRTLGGEELLSAHRVAASAWLLLGRTLLAGSYLARFERYAGVWSGFSGTLQRGEARVAIGLAPGARIALAYGVGHDGADLPALTWIEHGPRAELRLALARRLRVGLDAAVSLRRYAEFDESLGVTRRDVYLDGSAFGEWDVGRWFTIRVSLEGRKAFSSAAQLEYAKLFPSLGVAYLLAL
jgi:tetratricopeptide (TPR) repeat protein